MKSTVLHAIALAHYAIVFARAWAVLSQTSPHGNKKAALRFLTIAIGRNGKPGLINIDKSGANTAAIHDYNDQYNKRIKIRQCKYLNNIVEQDHRSVKRQCRAMLGFKSFSSAQRTLAGIELMHMIKKGQMRATPGDRLSPAEQFYALAA